MQFIHHHPFLFAWGLTTIVALGYLCYLCHKAPYLDWHD